MHAVTMEVGSRVAYWMRQVYMRDAAKLMARDFQCSPHTAKKWLLGEQPSNKHLNMMAQRWGKAFLAFIYEPIVGPWRDYAMDAELDDLKARIAAIEREFAHEPIEAPARAVVGATADEQVELPQAEGGPAASPADQVHDAPRTAAAARG